MADNTVQHMDSLHSFGNSYYHCMKYSTIMSATAEWLRRNLKQVLSDIVNKGDGLKKMAVLGVGSFNGEQDLIIIDQVDKSLKDEIPFHYTAVEPCTTALEEFERNAEEFFQNKKREINFEKMPVLFETFMERSKHSKEYDIIHFIYCINYMDAEKVLVHCFNNELEDGGKIMVFVVSKTSIVKAISDKFRGKKIPCDFDFYHFYTSANIEEIAKKYGWNTEILTFNVQLDFTECVIGSEEGDLIMEQVVKGDFRKHATPEIRQEVKQVLTELCLEENGRFIVNERAEVVVLRW